MALVKYNNNSLSSVTSAASFPAGALTHIKTLTASSSSTLSFVDGSSSVVLDNTYPVYLFKFINIHPATDNVKLTVGFRDGGTDYDAVKTTTAFYAYHKEDDSGTGLDYSTAYDLAQSTSFQNIAFELGNDNDQCCSGTMHLFNPSSTTFVKHFISNFQNIRYDNMSENDYVAGYCNTTTAIDGVQFKMTSGNIDSGTIKLYGIKDS
jgi:hypothetical protein